MGITNVELVGAAFLAVADSNPPVDIFLEIDGKEIVKKSKVISLLEEKDFIRAKLELCHQETA